MMQDYQHVLGQIRELLKKDPDGMSVTDLSKALGKNKNTVGRYLDILLISGQVDMRTYGMAKVYTLSQRVPLSAMLSYSRELIMVLDADSRIVDINDNFLKLLHLSRQNTVGKNLSYISPPDVDVHEMLETLSTGFPEHDHQITFSLKGKGERFFRQKSVPTVFEDGRKGLTVILEDITGRIIADRDIRESEERFRMMAENIQDGLLIIENDRHIFSNNRITEITGYSFEELKTMEPLAIVAPECKENAESQIKNLKENPERCGELQMWIITKAGERRFAYVRVTAVRHHETYYHFIIFTDLTELKQQEVRLRESEQRFRMMAENISDGLVVAENGNVVFANRRISEITGYSHEDLIRMKSTDLVTPEDYERLDEIIHNTRPDSGTPSQFTVWIKCKDGSRRCILGRVTAAWQESIMSTYITMTDITESTEREQALRDRLAALQQLLT
ncbi:PAS domain S-box protein [Methanoregula sp.]|jgi:PAS domain S-box-containing protein|uniref:PAS domain S-box protein n=1 Tax=Methanoregula sp. TaxID=2052170 RepID=UPI003C1600D6